MKNVLVWFLAVLSLWPFSVSADKRADRLKAIECAKKVALESKYVNLVAEPVTNLYKSIPVRIKFEYDGFTFVTERKTISSRTPYWEIITLVKLNGEEVGSVKRRFSKDGTTMILKGAYLKNSETKKIPKFINLEGVVPLVSGKGIPTQAFITLMQMKMAGITSGSLKSVQTDQINNYITGLELVHDPDVGKWIRQRPDIPVPTDLIAKALPLTLTGRYIMTVLTQSGYTVEKIEVIEPVLAYVYAFPADDEVENDPYVRLLRQEVDDSVMPIEFKLKFTVSPIH